MPLDATAIACLVSELRPRLIGGRLDKVYQPEKDEIQLTVRTPRENLRLLLCAGHAAPRLGLTEARKQNPAEAPMLCMLFRKHLGGGKILDISQPDFERVIRITVGTHTELGDEAVRILIAEFAGRNPNIILTDGEGKILDAVHHTDLTAGRGILPGMTYMPPPPQDKKDPFSVDEAACEALLSSMRAHKAERALSTLFRGISPMCARCIAAESTGREDAPVEGNEKALAAGFVRFFDRVRRGEFSPSLLLTPDGETVDFTAYTPYAARGTLEVRQMETMSKTLEAFYAERDKKDRMRQKGAALKKRATQLLERLQKKISIHISTLSDAENMETFRIYGELLCAGLHRAETGMEKITLENFYDEMRPVTIPLDKTKSPSQNAQLYFKKYRKLKTAAVVVREELARAKSEVAYLLAVLDSIERAEDKDALSEIRREMEAAGYIKEETRRKRQKEEPAQPLSYTIDDFSVLVGKNNRQNDMVTLRLSRAEDIWLHVKDMPGAHVLIRTMHREVPEAVIRKAAALAAYHSTARESGQVPVDYTRVKNVRKPAGARPGMVIYEKQKTLYVTPENL